MPVSTFPAEEEFACGSVFPDGQPLRKIETSNRIAILFILRFVLGKGD
jgi:hypothetical protein